MLLSDHRKISWKTGWVIFGDDVMVSKEIIIFDDKINHYVYSLKSID